MNNNNQQPLQSGVRWPVWLVIIVLLSVTLMALQRRYDKNHQSVQIHAELVTQQTTGEESVVTNQTSVTATNGVADVVSNANTPKHISFRIQPKLGKQ